MFCFSFIDVSPGRVYLHDKSSWNWKKFCFSNVIQLFSSPNELCDKNHSALYLKTIFNSLLADNLMFSSFFESKMLENCLTQGFVTHSLESLTFSVLISIFQTVIYLFFWHPDDFTLWAMHPVNIRKCMRDIFSFQNVGDEDL